MGREVLELTVYGAEEPCPSCLHAPSAIETKEWIEAAVARKFPDADIYTRYIDINAPETEIDKQFTEKILADEYFYPLVVAEGSVIGEGNPKLKRIFKYLEDKGCQAV